jgi:hypothetical protein
MAESERITKRPPVGVFGPSGDDDPEIYDRDTIPAPSTKSVTHRPDAASSPEQQILPPTLPGLDAASLIALEGDDEDDQDQIDTLRPPPMLTNEEGELGWQVEPLDEVAASPWAEPARVEPVHGLTMRPPPPAGFDAVASLAPTPVSAPAPVVSAQPPASLAPAVRETRESVPEAAAPKRSPAIVAAVLLLAGAGLAGLLASNSSNARQSSAAAPPGVAAPEPTAPAPSPAPSAAPQPKLEVPVVQPLPAVVIEVPQEGSPTAPRRRGRARETFVEPELEEPTRQAVVDSLNALRDELQVCTQGRSGIAEIDLTIAGSGAVSYAVVGGDYHGAQGSCIARTARKAKVAPFKKPRVRVLYKLSL